MKPLVFFLVLVSASAESLHYTINYPGGLNLGEATLRSTSFTSGSGPKSSIQSWDFVLDVDASIPGFAVRDHYQSTASGDLCSVQLDKSFTHGRHKSDEHISFDQEQHIATRQTKNDGGKSDQSMSACAHDALTFIQFVRRELEQGKLVPQQQVVFGALYSVRIEYKGVQTIKLGDKRMESDRIVAAIKGPSSNVTAEIFFSRDAARIPLIAKIPLSPGIISVELQQ